jgi:hypothetical protein
VVATEMWPAGPLWAAGLVFIVVTFAMSIWVWLDDLRGVKREEEHPQVGDPASAVRSTARTRSSGDGPEALVKGEPCEGSDPALD